MQKIEFWPLSTSTFKYDILIGNNTLFQVSQGTETKWVKLLGEYHLGTKCQCVVVN